MHLTVKQIELLRIISAGNPDGSPVDLDEILERASYKPTKESLQFSIRALIGHALIEKKGTEKRRGRRRVLISATDLGKHFATPVSAVPFVTSVEDDAITEELLES